MPEVLTTSLRQTSKVNKNLFLQETHPLTFMLQNYDEDILWTHGLHWQQP